VIASITFLWAAMLMMVQSFTDVPRRHGAALALALIPHLADVLYTYVRDALGAFGVYLEDVLTFNSVDEVSTALLEYGVVWKGVAALRHGAIITSILWATIMVFVIDRRMNKAGFTFIIAAALSFFGFIHSPALGIGFAAMSTPYTIGYLVCAALCFLFDRTKDKLMDVPRRYDYV
jgi:AGZA family xanthine/uracil permease-like MFS transporter